MLSHHFSRILSIVSPPPLSLSLRSERRPTTKILLVIVIKQLIERQCNQIKSIFSSIWVFRNIFRRNWRVVENAQSKHSLKNEDNCVKLPSTITFRRNVDLNKYSNKLIQLMSLIIELLCLSIISNFTER